MSDALQLFDDMEADIASAARTITEKIVIDVQDRIGKPVGFIIGPRGGTKKIRSKPGEPPRKDTGTLQAGMTSEVIAVVGQVAGSVFDEVPYAERLEGSLDRPILTDLAETYEDYIADGLARAAAGEF